MRLAHRERLGKEPLGLYAARLCGPSFCPAADHNEDRAYDAAVLTTGYLRGGPARVVTLIGAKDSGVPFLMAPGWAPSVIDTRSAQSRRHSPRHFVRRSRIATFITYAPAVRDAERRM
jgi:hypothetical protein